MLKTLFFPGSFNPFTVGHADIVERALTLAEKVIIGVGYNCAKPESASSAQERADAIGIRYESEPRVDVMCYGGLTARAACRAGADALLRGLRNAADFDYEYPLAAANRSVFGIETVFLPCSPELAFVSSSLVRDIIAAGEPETAARFLQTKD